MSEAFIACLNIEKFRELLRSCNDEAQRHMLMTLIADEEQKLAGMSLPRGAEPPRGGDVAMAFPLAGKSDDPA